MGGRIETARTTAASFVAFAREMKLGAVAVVIGGVLGQDGRGVVLVVVRLHLGVLYGSLGCEGASEEVDVGLDL